MKKPIILVIVAGVLTLSAFLVYKGKEYYDNRYVGSDYYAQLPSDQSMEVEDILDASGKKQDVGRNYRVVAFDESGNERVLEFTVTGENNLLKPNTFLRISASTQIVLETHVIQESEIPAKALEKIKGNHK